jgi:hypothetical protein
MQGPWVAGSAPGVITGYLFSSPAWQRQEEPLVIAPNTAAARIRATAKHLMDIDFQFGGGYVLSGAVVILAGAGGSGAAEVAPEGHTCWRL